MNIDNIKFLNTAETKIRVYAEDIIDMAYPTEDEDVLSWVAAHTIEPCLVITGIKWYEDETRIMINNAFITKYPCIDPDYADAVAEWLLTHEITAYYDPTDYQAKMRIVRNEKLLNCDWTQLPDSPLTAEEKIEWADYRQLLRDFPNEHPEVVDKETYDALVWPEEP